MALIEDVSELQSKTEAELSDLLRNAATREQVIAAEQALQKLRDARLQILVADFNAATAAFMDLTDELQRVIEAVEARPPSDRALRTLNGLMGTTATLYAGLRDPERFASATESEEITITLPIRDEEDAPPAAAVGPTPAAAGGGNGNAPLRLPPLNSRNYPALRDEYLAFFDAAEPRRQWADHLVFYLTRLKRNRDRYRAVGEPLGIPWYFVGCIHALECGFNFNAHMFNGDPLTARTVRVPSGQPQADPTAGPGTPYTWEESARAAMVFKGFHRMTDWSLPRVLYRWEAYNGFGYRPQGVPTPYLWSFSNLYERGRYVADHRFDPNAVSKQAGAAILLRMLIDDGAASLPSG